jgi:hypothetical protein
LFKARYRNAKVWGYAGELDAFYQGKTVADTRRYSWGRNDELLGRCSEVKVCFLLPLVTKKLEDEDWEEM